MLRSPMAMLSGSENCARKPPAARLVDPLASWSRSRRQTSTPASARWNATLVPMTPPPTTTTSAAARERAHRRTRFLRKKPTFAGRSARRRMRYGYQSGPYGRRDEHLVALRRDRALEPRPDAVEHLELEPVAGDLLARRERLHLPDERLVVRGDGDVRALAQAALHQRDVRTIHVSLVGERDRVGLEVRTLDDAEVGSAREEALEVGGRAVEVGLKHGAHAVVPRVAEALEETERQVDVLRLLHVDADEGSELAGARYESLDVGVRDLLVEGQPEVRELECDVRLQLLRHQPLDDVLVRVGHGFRARGVGNRFAEERRVRVETGGRSASAGRRRTRRASHRRRSVRLRRVCRAAARCAVAGGCPPRGGSPPGAATRWLLRRPSSGAETTASRRRASCCSDRAALLQGDGTGRPCDVTRCSRAHRAHR